MMKQKNWVKTGNVFQALGGGASFIFVVLSLFGVTQTQFPSVSGLASYTVTDTPLKFIIYFSLGMVAILSFLIAYIAKRQSKKRK